jgi:hypothetical protein
MKSNAMNVVNTFQRTMLVVPFVMLRNRMKVERPLGALLCYGTRSHAGGEVKLKDKLAIEASRLEVSCDESVRVNDLAKRMYLTGFEKAKRIILEDYPECEKHDNWIEAPYSYFKNLGEEEV